MMENGRFQKYIIESHLRSVGNYMEIYRARQPGLDRLVELRILGKAVSEDSSDFRRFRREFRLLAALDHPGIVKLLDLGCHEGRLFYTTVYREAASLEEMLSVTGRPFSPGEVLDIGIELTKAVGCMHEAGLIHRNLSTRTVFYDLVNLRPYIADFATLKQDAGDELSRSGIPFVYDSFFTPEQMFDRPIDSRTDLYLLGTVLYRLLTGRHACSRKALLKSDIRGAFRVPAPSESIDGIPKEFDRVVMRLLDIEPDRRHQVFDELLDDLLGLSKKCGGYPHDS